MTPVEVEGTIHKALIISKISTVLEANITVSTASFSQAICRIANKCQPIADKFVADPTCCILKSFTPRACSIRFGGPQCFAGPHQVGSNLFVCKGFFDTKKCVEKLLMIKTLTGILRLGPCGLHDA
jgi:hypothetical protein